jgi:hypothetical protein
MRTREWVGGWMLWIIIFLNVSTNRSNTIVPVRWFSLLPLPTVLHSIVGTQAAVCCILLASSVRASKCWECGRQPTSTALTTPSTQPVQLYNRKYDQSFISFFSFLLNICTSKFTRDVGDRSYLCGIPVTIIFVSLYSFTYSSIPLSPSLVLFFYTSLDPVHKTIWPFFVALLLPSFGLLTICPWFYISSHLKVLPKS